MCPGVCPRANSPRLVNPGVAAKLMSAVWTVEEMDGRLLGRIDCHLKEPLTTDEMVDLREEILGQCSDGLGEGFEQRPIDTDEGDLYVSYRVREAKLLNRQ